MGVHVDIRPFKIMMLEGFLKGDYSRQGDWVECEVLGVCSYEGELPTFRVKVGYAIYDYLPVMAFGCGYEVCKGINCPDIDITYSFSDHLDVECSVITRSGLSEGWQYRGTIDWYEDNVSMHILESNGALVFAPNYAVLFGKGATMQDVPIGWKKMREVWTADQIKNSYLATAKTADAVEALAVQVGYTVSVSSVDGEKS